MKDRQGGIEAEYEVRKNSWSKAIKGKSKRIKNRFLTVESDSREI